MSDNKDTLEPPTTLDTDVNDDTAKIKEYLDSLKKKMEMNKHSEINNTEKKSETSDIKKTRET